MERIAPGSRKAARVFVCAGFGRGAMGEDGQRARFPSRIAVVVSLRAAVKQRGAWRTCAAL